MGERGPAPKRINKPVSGWRNHPSDRRLEIEAEIGMILPKADWSRINHEWRHMDIQSDVLRIPTIGHSRFQPESDDLEVRNSANKRERASYEGSYVAWKTHELARLRAKADRLNDMQMSVEEFRVRDNIAKLESEIPEPGDYPSESEAKARTTLGIARAVSKFMSIEAPKRLRKNGFTDFQKLICALGIHQTSSDSAFALWLWRTMKRYVP